MAHTLSVPMPPMECIAAAMAAARLGSFSAAAEELGVTHTTVSRRVAGAEAWAGMKLFDRHGRGVRPTNHGQLMLMRLARALEDVNAVVERERAPRRRPVVRLSVTPTFARFWIFPRLGELERDDVSIEVVAELRTADIERGEVDIAIRYGKGGWKMDYEEPLFDERLAPFALAATYPTLADAETSEILQMPLLHNSVTEGWRSWASHYGLTVRRKSADRVLSDTGQVVDAAMSGLGVGLWLTSLSPISAAPPGAIVRADLMAPSPTSYFLIMRTPRPGGHVELVADRIRAAAREQ